MTVRFALTEDDFVYLWRYSLGRQSRPITLVARLVVFVVGMAAVLFLAGSVAGGGMAVLYSIVPLTVIIPLGLYMRYSPSVVRQTIQKQFRESRGLLGERIIRITPEFIYQKTTYVESRAQWACLVDIVDEKNYILMVQTGSSFLYGYFIPKSAFASTEHADLFVRAARAYWKGEPPPVEATADQESTVWPPPPKTQL